MGAADLYPVGTGDAVPASGFRHSRSHFPQFGMQNPSRTRAGERPGRVSAQTPDRAAEASGRGRSRFFDGFTGAVG